MFNNIKKLRRKAEILAKPIFISFVKTENLNSLFENTEMTTFAQNLSGNNSEKKKR